MHVPVLVLVVSSLAGVQREWQPAPSWGDVSRIAGDKLAVSNLEAACRSAKECGSELPSLKARWGIRLHSTSAILKGSGVLKVVVAIQQADGLSEGNHLKKGDFLLEPPCVHNAFFSPFRRDFCNISVGKMYSGTHHANLHYQLHHIRTHACGFVFVCPSGNFDTGRRHEMRSWVLPVSVVMVSHDCPICIEALTDNH